MLDGTELIYLDRVESDWPLQICLNIGSRVPLHCTASGKLFLSLTPDSFRKALFAAARCSNIRRKPSSTLRRWRQR